MKEFSSLHFEKDLQNTIAAGLKSVYGADANLTVPSDKRGFEPLYVVQIGELAIVVCGP